MRSLRWSGTRACTPGFTTRSTSSSAPSAGSGSRSSPGSTSIDSSAAPMRSLQQVDETPDDQEHPDDECPTSRQGAGVAREPGLEAVDRVPGPIWGHEEPDQGHLE